MPPELTAVDLANVDAALRADPEAAEDLRPLLEGEDGLAARDLFLRCYAAHLRAGRLPFLALLPAFADALHISRPR